MVRLVVIILLITLFVSCQYRIQTVNGEKVFVGNPHRLFNESIENYHQIIDTNAVYYENKEEFTLYLKFDSNGWMKKAYGLSDEDFNQSPKSTSKGRYFIERNRIKIELFFPGDSFRESARHRSIWKGEINGDTLNLKYVNGTRVFVKSHKYYFENGELKMRSLDKD